MGRKNIQIQRRLQIIEALNRCLLKKSYRETTIKDIAGEAGINHGMLHYYFKDKEEILLNFIDHVLNRQKSRFYKWYSTQDFSGRSQQEMMEALLEYISEKITMNRNLAKIFIIFWELSLNNRRVKSKLKRVYQEWIDVSIESIESPQGKMDKKVAFSLVAYLEGMALFSILFNLKKSENREMLKEFQQVFLKGFFAQ